MKPIKLTLKNFGPYVNETIDFSRFQDSSLFLINGKTGSGKTTIFDAMCYALYDATSAGKTGRAAKEMRSKFADPHAETTVSFTFSHQNKTYQIERTMKASKDLAKINKKVSLSYLTADGKIESISDGITEVGQKISDLIGLDAKQFSQVILLPQGEFDNFLKANANQKNELLERFFDTSIYKRLEEKLVEKSKQLQADVKTSLKVMEQERTIYSEYEAKTDEEWLLLVKAALARMQVVVNEKNQIIAKKDGKLSELRQQLGSQEQLQAQLTRKKELAERRKQLLTQGPDFEARGLKLAKLQWAGKQENTWQLLNKVQGDLKAKRGLVDKISSEVARLTDKQQQLVNEEPKIVQLKQDMQAKQQVVTKLAEVKPYYEKYEQQLVFRNKQQSFLNKQQEKQAQLVARLQVTKEVEASLQAQLAKLPVVEQIQQAFFENEQKLTLLKQQRGQLIQDYQRLTSLKEEQEKTNQALARLGQEVERAKNNYHELDQEYTRLQIVRLTQKLQPGKPCPVCGSVEHPLVVAGQTADLKVLNKVEAQLEKAQTTFTEVDSKYQRLNGTLASLKQNYQQAQETYTKNLQQLLANYGLQTGSQLRQLLGELEAKQTAYQQKLQQTKEKKASLEEKQAQNQLTQNQVNKDYEQAQSDIQKAEMDYHQAEVKLASVKANLLADYQDQQAITSEIKRLEAEIEVATSQALAFENRRAKTNEQLVIAKTHLDNTKTSQNELQTQLKGYQQQLQLALSQVDFAETLADLGTLLQEVNEIQTLSEEISAYHNEVQLVTKELADLTEQTQAVKVISLIDLKEEIATKNEEVQKLRADASELTAKMQQLAISYNRVDAELKKSQDKIIQLNRVLALSEPINGHGAGKIDLQRFVLRQYFQKILGNANVILQELTQDRYLFQMTTTQATYGTQAGLVLDVVDKISGERRRTQTLSGGEGFIASLSLALGLAETIQEENGGVRIEALFIDEGFGSLDTDYLARAIDYLQAKEGTNRMVGIISHVRELKESIPDRLEVHNHDGKSTVSYHL